MKKQFDYSDDALKTTLDGGVSAVEGVDTLAEELYSRCGGRFRVEFPPWATGEPIVHTDTLPSAVSEGDVEAALGDMKADGLL